ncbi:MAG: RnfH family protein [Gammaproteobacteria bacterium]|nr:RnfH family protein [Gammaproteobacteria bacterium]
MRVEIVYALPDQQKRYWVALEENASLEQAIVLSGVLQDFPDLQNTTYSVGIWGHRAELDTVLHEDDRVEIYRPLLMDPKASRQLQVKKDRKGRKRSFYPAKA